MKKGSRLWALLLAIVLITSMVPSVMAEAAERKTVSIGITLNTNVENYDTNAYTVWLEEQMNIDIEFVLFEDIEQKLPVMINAGAELPDMIYHSIGNSVLMNWASQGVFVPLTEYWNNPELTQNFYKDLDGNKELADYILKSVTMPDGEIYTLPSYDENIWNLRPHRVWINQVWQEKLGLQTPTTLDEFVDVLRHFVNDDPNGNGIKDEIGLTGGNFNGSNPMVWLMNSFIHCTPASDYMNVEDGKVVPAFTQDAYKAGLKFIHGLYEEGLIDPLSFTQDKNQMRAVINGEEMLCGFVACLSQSNFQADRKEDYVLLAPVAGPEGIHYAASHEVSPINRVFITCDAEDPELCFRIAEFNHTYESRFRSRHGVPGENWTDDPEVVAQWIGNYEAIGYNPTMVLLNDVWGKQQNANWGVDSLPYVFTQLDAMTEIASMPRTPENEKKLTAVAQHYMSYTSCPEELLGYLTHTEDEMEVINSVAPGLKSYIEEMSTAFIVGSKSFDEWDSYVSEFDNMGLEEYVNVLQAAYDRKVK